MPKEALLYERQENEKVKCFLCNHYCTIDDEKLGFCLVRENKGGVLYTNNYARLAACNIDPIEKKPLFHFLPGTSSLSIAAAGCNFRCGFCQNWQISQIKERYKDFTQEEISPETTLKQAIKSGCSSISYTYTEPTIFFEYALDCARLAKRDGLYNTFVTNGYMSPQALEMINPYLDAVNIDLKSFNADFYRKTCSSQLEPVLENIRLMKKLGIWIEITTLIIPGLNDSEEELKKIAEFIASVGVEIPWHISKFHPDYKMLDRSPTPITVLKNAYDIGKYAGLRYIYIGNVLGEEESTYCYKCKKPVIKRIGFEVSETNMEDGNCSFCKAKIDGVGLFY